MYVARGSFEKGHLESHNYYFTSVDVFFLHQGKRKAAQPFKPSIMSTKDMNLNFVAAASSAKDQKSTSTSKVFKPTVTSTKDINLNFSSYKTPVNQKAGTKQQAPVSGKTNITASARKSTGASQMSTRKSLGAAAAAAKKSVSSKGQAFVFDLAFMNTVIKMYNAHNHTHTLSLSFPFLFSLSSLSVCLSLSPHSLTCIDTHTQHSVALAWAVADEENKHVESLSFITMTVSTAVLVVYYD